MNYFDQKLTGEDKNARVHRNELESRVNEEMLEYTMQIYNAQKVPCSIM